MWFCVKIVRIENDRIKVVLSESDLLDMNINFADIRPESDEMNSFLTKIIKAVSDETGLFIEEGQIMVDSAKDEGCVEVFVTRLCNPERAKKRSRRCDRVIFEVASFGELCDMMCAVNEKILKRMCIYRYKTGFYISVPKFPLPLALCEFSKRCRKNRILEAVLLEHGEVVAKDEEVRNLAEVIKKMI